MAGYSRYLAPKGGPVPAWEYFPTGAGIPVPGGRASRRLVQSYLLSRLAPSSARAYGATGAPVLAPGSSAAVRLDARASVCVPARFVRQVALQPGDQVRVFIDAMHSQLVVRPGGAGSGPNGLPARRYTVDRHYNIRITESTQVRAGLQGLCRQIQPHRDELIVTAA
jgi:hypothetical protein